MVGSSAGALPARARQPQIERLQIQARPGAVVARVLGGQRQSCRRGPPRARAVRRQSSTRRARPAPAVHGARSAPPTSRCNSGQLARYAAIIASCAMRPRNSPRMSSGPTLVWSCSSSTYSHAGAPPPLRSIGVQQVGFAVAQAVVDEADRLPPEARPHQFTADRLRQVCPQQAGRLGLLSEHGTEQVIVGLGNLAGRDSAATVLTDPNRCQRSIVSTFPLNSLVPAQHRAVAPRDTAPGTGAVTGSGTGAFL